MEINIYKKLALATEKIDRVAKNLKVGVGNSQYKAVGEADVLAAVKPIENEFGIYSYPLKRELVSTNEFTTTSEYNGTTKEKITIFMRIKTVYRFVNIDNPNDFVDVETFGDGVDAQDKAPGKAMTYADKYALLKAYKIETGDDPDQNASKEMKKVKVDGGNYVLTSGKYTTKTLQQIYEKDKQYLIDLIASGKIGTDLKVNIERCFADNGEEIIKFGKSFN